MILISLSIKIINIFVPIIFSKEKTNVVYVHTSSITIGWPWSKCVSLSQFSLTCFSWPITHWSKQLWGNNLDWDACLLCHIVGFSQLKTRIWGKARSSSLSVPMSLKRLKVKRIIEVILKLFSFVLGTTHLSHVQFMWTDN